MAKEVTDYTKLIPPPPDDLVEELLRQGAFKDTDIVIYKAGYAFNALTDRNERMAKCVCTACGETWFEEWAENYGIFDGKRHVKDCTKWECPHCQAKVELKHSSHIREHSSYNKHEWIMVFGKIENKFTAAEYVVIQQFSKNGDKRYVVRNYNAYVFETDEKCVMLQGYRKNINSVTFLEYWWQKSRCSNISDAVWYIYPYAEDFIQGTTAENSRLDKYLVYGDELHPVNYLKLWQRRHNVETLMDIGVGFIIHKELKGFNSNRYYNDTVSNLMPDFNWKEKSPFKITGCNRNELKLIKKYRLTYQDLVNFNRLKEYGVPFTEENLLVLKQWHFSDIIQLMTKKMPVIKTLRYLNRQKKDVRYYFDYLDMARELDYDLSSDFILWPKNLPRRHDELVALVKWKEDKELKERFENLARQLEVETEIIEEAVAKARAEFEKEKATAVKDAVKAEKDKAAAKAEKQIQKATEDAVAKAKEEWQAAADQQNTQLQTAVAEAQNKAAALEKQLAIKGDDKLVKFSILFEQVQTDLIACVNLINAISTEDAEKAEKYKNALKIACDTALGGN